MVRLSPLSLEQNETRNIYNIIKDEKRAFLRLGLQKFARSPGTKFFMVIQQK